MRNRIAAPLMALMVIMAGGPARADSFSQRYEAGGPAVSGFNGKLDLGYIYSGNANSALFPGLGKTVSNGFSAQGSLAAPLSHAFGFQLDLGLEKSRTKTPAGTFSTTSGGVGAHAFWRDPALGLIGGYGQYVHIDLGNTKADGFQYGVEAEAYFGRFSLELFAGADTFRARTAGVTISQGTKFNAQAALAFYPVDNFRIHAGVRHSFGQTSAIGGAEYLLDTGLAAAPALYVNASYSSRQTSLAAGLRVYFGAPSKSLIARHREDDPQSGLQATMASLASHAANASPFPGLPQFGDGGLITKPVNTPFF